MQGYETYVFAGQQTAYATITPVEIIVVNTDDATIVRAGGKIRQGADRIYASEREAWRAARSGLVAAAARATAEARRISVEILGEEEVPSC